MSIKKFMLDTNIMSDMLKYPHGPAAQKARLHQDELCTSIVVAAELRYGCARKGSPVLLRKINDLLAAVGVLGFDVPVDRHYGELRHELEAAGQPIGANDLFIAAHARSAALTLVTANVREFSRVSNLRVENWSVAAA